MSINLLAITGPTASGKTSLSLSIAKDTKAEVLSSDSLLVYKGLNIGTAKPTIEERKIVKHHLIDIVDPDQNYTTSDYYNDARAIIRAISSENKHFIVSGGSGFYLNSLINSPFGAPKASKEAKLRIEEMLKTGYSLKSLHDELRLIDPETANRVHPNDKYRITRALEVYYTSGKTMSFFRTRHTEAKDVDFNTLIVVLNPEKDELKKNIEIRTKNMFELGLVDEVKGLLSKGYTEDLKPLRSIGYKECIAFIRGLISFDEAVEQINKNTLALAKRQITWFKKQNNTLWVHPSKDTAKIRNSVLKFMGV